MRFKKGDNVHIVYCAQIPSMVSNATVAAVYKATQCYRIDRWGSIPAKRVFPCNAEGLAAANEALRARLIETRDSYLDVANRCNEALGELD